MTRSVSGRKNGLCGEVGELLLVQQEEKRTKKADAGSRCCCCSMFWLKGGDPRIPSTPSPTLPPKCFFCRRNSHRTKKGMCGGFSMFWSPTTPACAREGGQLSAAAAV